MEVRPGAYHLKDMNIECSYGGVDDGVTVLESVSSTGATILTQVGDIGSSLTIKFELGGTTFIRSGYIVWIDSSPRTVVKFRIRSTKEESLELLNAWASYQSRTSNESSK